MTLVDGSAAITRKTDRAFKSGLLSKQLLQSCCNRWIDARENDVVTLFWLTLYSWIFQSAATSNLVVKLSDATTLAAAAAAEKERIYLRRMQQMAAAGNMGILNPFVFNQFGSYGTFAAAQVCGIKHN